MSILGKVSNGEMKIFQLCLEGSPSVFYVFVLLLFSSENFEQQNVHKKIKLVSEIVPVLVNTT